MRLIVAEVFLSQLSQLTASPLSAPGTIDIQARITDLTSDLTRLPESGPIAGALLGASCAARLSGGAISSLVVAGGRDCLPDPADAAEPADPRWRPRATAASPRIAFSDGEAEEVFAPRCGSSVLRDSVRSDRRHAQGPLVPRRRAGVQVSRPPCQAPRSRSSAIRRGDRASNRRSSARSCARRPRPCPHCPSSPHRCRATSSWFPACRCSCAKFASGA